MTLRPRETTREFTPLTTALKSGAPRRPRATVRKPKRASPPAALAHVLKSLDEAKAEDIVSIDLTGRTPMADFMIVATGRSDRHVGAIADRIAHDLKDAGLRVPRIEGQPQCDWVLVDAGDVIVHVFRAEVREFYNLEKMWRPDAEAATLTA